MPHSVKLFVTLYFFSSKPGQKTSNKAIWCVQKYIFIFFRNGIFKKKEKKKTHEQTNQLRREWQFYKHLFQVNNFTETQKYKSPYPYHFYWRNENNPIASNIILFLFFLNDQKTSRALITCWVTANIEFMVDLSIPPWRKWLGFLCLEPDCLDL